MPPEDRLAPHLTSVELRERYQRAVHPADRTRWHGLWLVSQGRAHREVARLVGRSHTWVNDVVRLYNERGPDAVATHKRAGESRGGKPAALDAEGFAALDHAVTHEAPPGGGLWTSAKVARWIEARTGKRPDVVTGWKYLKKTGYSQQSTRPAHPEAASREEQAAFQKKSSR
jgi:transposase